MNLRKHLQFQAFLKWRFLFAMLMVLGIDASAADGMLRFGAHGLAIIIILLLSPSITLMLMLTTLISIVYLLIDIKWDIVAQYGGFNTVNITYLFAFYAPIILPLYAASLFAYRKRSSEAIRA